MPLRNDPAVWFKDLFVHAGLSYSFSSILSTIALVLIVILFSWISNLLAKAIIRKIVTRIVKKQTIIMRHRPFEGNGLPLQLYLFTKSNQFIPFENLQSEIFEHLLAIMNEFGLRVFQQPTGDDLQTLSKK